MINKSSSNQLCGRDGECKMARLKSLSIFNFSEKKNDKGTDYAVQLGRQVFVFVVIMLQN